MKICDFSLRFEFEVAKEQLRNFSIKEVFIWKDIIVEMTTLGLHKEP